MAENAQEAGFMSGQISSDEPSFLLVISTLSDQGLIQMRLWAFDQTQEKNFCEFWYHRIFSWNLKYVEDVVWEVENIR